MFVLSEEQQLIQDSARKLLDADYEFEQRKQRLAASPTFDADVWRQFAELGWLGIALPEDDGGFGGDIAELALIGQELGRRIVVEPFLPTVVLGGDLVATGANAELRTRLLAEMMSGDTQFAVAVAEPASRYELARVTTTATRQGDGFILSGKKSVVLNAASANYIIVAARTSGDVASERGITLFLIPVDTPGVRVAGFRLNDGHHAGDVTLANVKLEANHVLGEVDQGFDLLEASVDKATVVACAEALGAMDMVMEMTAEYLQTRVQFGRPISTNQALKFRMVDMHYALEEARSLTAGAIHALHGERGAARAMVSAAKVLTGKAARFVGQEGIQLHGAIGMTEDYAVGHYYKRLETLRMLFGDPEYHLARYGRWNRPANHPG